MDQKRRSSKSSDRMSISNGPVSITGGQLRSKRHLLKNVYASFWQRHVGRDRTVFYWGLACSRPSLMPKYCSSQTSRSPGTDTRRYTQGERGDLSGCTCMESESRTLEESCLVNRFRLNFFACLI